MLEKKKLLETTEYWFDELQNELYRQVSNYMESKNLNQVKLAQELGVSKGYISQVLNGNCNFSLKKIVELSLSIGKAPIINYVDLSNSVDIEKLSNYFSENIKNTVIINSSENSIEYNLKENNEFTLSLSELKTIIGSNYEGNNNSHLLAA